MFHKLKSTWKTRPTYNKTRKKKQKPLEIYGIRLFSVNRPHSNPFPYPCAYPMDDMNSLPAYLEWNSSSRSSYYTNDILPSNSSDITMKNIADHMNTLSLNNTSPKEDNELEPDCIEKCEKFIDNDLCLDTEIEHQDVIVNSNADEIEDVVREPIGNDSSSEITWNSTEEGSESDSIDFSELTYDPLQKCVNQRIRSSLQTGCLDLSEMGLPFFPLAILSMETENITRLCLQDNSLVTIPGPALRQLVSLTWLDIRFNKLENLSPEISFIIPLKVLLLQDNLLKTLPLELGRLQNLSTLKVSENPLIFPPSDVIDLGTDEILKCLRTKELDLYEETKETRSSTSYNESELESEDSPEKSTLVYEKGDISSGISLGDDLSYFEEETDQSEEIFEEGNNINFCTCEQSIADNYQNQNTKMDNTILEKNECKKKYLHLMIQSPKHKNLSTIDDSACKNCHLPIGCHTEPERKKSVPFLELVFHSEPEKELLASNKNLMKPKSKWLKRECPRLISQEKVNQRAQADIKRRELIELATSELRNLDKIRAHLGLHEWREELRKEQFLKAKGHTENVYQLTNNVFNTEEQDNTTANRWLNTSDLYAELQFCMSKIEEFKNEDNLLQKRRRYQPKNSIKDIETIVKRLTCLQQQLLHARETA